MRRELSETFGLPSANVIDQASLKRRSMEIFERTFSVTAALNVLTLGVAGVALFASMTTLSGMRLPQLAPVWAMGLTRRHLVSLEFLGILFQELLPPDGHFTIAMSWHNVPAINDGKDPIVGKFAAVAFAQPSSRRNPRTSRSPCFDRRSIRRFHRAG